LLHSGFPQNRLVSGTCGSIMIAAAGSPLGIRGIAMIPAPRRPRVPAELDVLPVRAVRTDGADLAVELLDGDEITEGVDGMGAGAVPQTSQ
jgi:hypothetical protein